MFMIISYATKMPASKALQLFFHNYGPTRNRQLGYRHPLAVLMGRKN
jgi:hypothetical protein